MKSKKIAILASIPDEIGVFSELIKNHKWDDKEVYLGVGGVGKASAATITQKVISEEQPDIIFYTGFAGALDRTVKLHDLAIVSAAIDAEMDARSFDSGLMLGEYPFTEERVFYTSKDLLDIALGCPLNFRIFDAYAATVSQFMDNARKEQFNKDVKPLLKAEIYGKARTPNIIDMECAGFMLAAKANGIPCLALKTIANTAKGNARSEYFETLVKRVQIYFELVAYIKTRL